MPAENGRVGLSLYLALLSPTLLPSEDTEDTNNPVHPQDSPSLPMVLAPMSTPGGHQPLPQ